MAWGFAYLPHVWSTENQYYLSSSSSMKVPLSSSRIYKALYPQRLIKSKAKDLKSIYKIILYRGNSI